MVTFVGFIAFLYYFVSTASSQGCPEGSNVAKMCVPGTFSGQRVLIDMSYYNSSVADCSCTFGTTSSTLKLVTYVAPNYQGCNSAIRLYSSSGNNIRFHCLMSGTYLDTSVYNAGVATFETYADVYDSNYCLLLEIAGRIGDTITVTCTSGVMNEMTSTENTSQSATYTVTTESPKSDSHRDGTYNGTINTAITHSQKSTTDPNFAKPDLTGTTENAEAVPAMPTVNATASVTTSNLKLQSNLVSSETATAFSVSRVASVEITTTSSSSNDAVSNDAVSTINPVTENVSNVNTTSTVGKSSVYFVPELIISPVTLSTYKGNLLSLVLNDSLQVTNESNNTYEAVNHLRPTEPTADVGNTDIPISAMTSTAEISSKQEHNVMFKARSFAEGSVKSTTLSDSLYGTVTSSSSSEAYVTSIVDELQMTTVPYELNNTNIASKIKVEPTSAVLRESTATGLNLSSNSHDSMTTPAPIVYSLPDSSNTTNEAGSINYRVGSIKPSETENSVQDNIITSFVTGTVLFNGGGSNSPKTIQNIGAVSNQFASIEQDTDTPLVDNNKLSATTQFILNSDGMPQQEITTESLRNDNTQASIKPTDVANALVMTVAPSRNIEANGSLGVNTKGDEVKNFDLKFPTAGDHLITVSQNTTHTLPLTTPRTDTALANSNKSTKITSNIEITTNNNNMGIITETQTRAVKPSDNFYTIKSYKPAVVAAEFRAEPVRFDMSNSFSNEVYDPPNIGNQAFTTNEAKYVTEKTEPSSFIARISERAAYIPDNETYSFFENTDSNNTMNETANALDTKAKSLLAVLDKHNNTSNETAEVDNTSSEFVSSILTVPSQSSTSPLNNMIKEYVTSTNTPHIGHGLVTDSFHSNTGVHINLLSHSSYTDTSTELTSTLGNTISETDGLNMFDTSTVPSRPDHQSMDRLSETISVAKSDPGQETSGQSTVVVNLGSDQDLSKPMSTTTHSQLASAEVFLGSSPSNKVLVSDVLLNVNNANVDQSNATPNQADAIHAIKVSSTGTPLGALGTSKKSSIPAAELIVAESEPRYNGGSLRAMFANIEESSPASATTPSGKENANVMRFTASFTDKPAFTVLSRLSLTETKPSNMQTDTFSTDSAESNQRESTSFNGASDTTTLIYKSSFINLSPRVSETFESLQKSYTTGTTNDALIMETSTTEPVIVEKVMARSSVSNAVSELEPQANNSRSPTVTERTDYFLANLESQIIQEVTSATAEKRMTTTTVSSKVNTRFGSESADVVTKQVESSTTAADNVAEVNSNKLSSTIVSDKVDTSFGSERVDVMNKQVESSNTAADNVTEIKNNEPTPPIVKIPNDIKITTTGVPVTSPKVYDPSTIKDKIINIQAVTDIAPIEAKDNNINVQASTDVAHIEAKDNNINVQISTDIAHIEAKDNNINVQVSTDIAPIEAKDNLLNKPTTPAEWFSVVGDTVVLADERDPKKVGTAGDATDGKGINVSLDTGNIGLPDIDMNNDTYIMVVGGIVGLVLLALVIGILCHNGRKRSVEKVNISSSDQGAATHENRAFDAEATDLEQGTSHIDSTTGAVEENGETSSFPAKEKNGNL